TRDKNGTFGALCMDLKFYHAMDDKADYNAGECPGTDNVANTSWVLWGQPRNASLSGTRGTGFISYGGGAFVGATLAGAPGPTTSRTPPGCCGGSPATHPSAGPAAPVSSAMAAARLVAAHGRWRSGATPTRPHGPTRATPRWRPA